MLYLISNNFYILVLYNITTRKIKKYVNTYKDITVKYISWHPTTIIYLKQPTAKPKKEAD